MMPVTGRNISIVALNDTSLAFFLFIPSGVNSLQSTDVIFGHLQCLESTLTLTVDCCRISEDQGDLDFNITGLVSSLKH